MSDIDRTVETLQDRWERAAERVEVYLPAAFDNPTGESAQIAGAWAAIATHTRYMLEAATNIQARKG